MPRLRVRPLSNFVQAVDAAGMQHVFPLHIHHSLVVGLVTRGARIMLYRQESKTILQNEIFIVHPGEPHACTPLNNQPQDYRALCIPPALINTLYPACPLLFAHHLDHPQAVKALLACFSSLDSNPDPQIKAATIIDFFQKFASRWGACAPVEPPNATIQLMLGFLEHNLIKKMDIFTLGSAVSMSPYYLNHLFRQKVGLAPHSYQIHAKIHRSQTLLSLGLSPARAAFELGFSDQSHFSKFFKKLVGVTPAIYQRLNRETPSNVP